ncbi:hypothetical protein HMPREF0105_1872 [Bacteroides sp. 3_1_33FAA]|uniref:Uncharacterized protein n=1 Tax=Phocaeicola dorei DSM 17855 TaxID=483217 RepID=B6VXT7_9BACT|nr:hypothetical protein BACDOR_02070 [Phocaeicola dorei DSM 17855]EEZ21318.1 hypothetical protein HMPREF0105_1872 [Bacteroides sp. 3_1_33FAA]
MKNIKKSKKTFDGLLFVGYIKKNVLYGFKYALKWILMRCKITLEISLF